MNIRWELHKLLHYRRMASRKKDRIPMAIKKKVWFRDCFDSDLRIAQCKTCSNIVQMPESVRKSMRYQPIHYDQQPICGVGEYGHVLSEFHGGKATVNNLYIQCKPCNIQLSTQRMDLRPIDQIMLDLNIDNAHNDNNHDDDDDAKTFDDQEEMDIERGQYCNQYLPKQKRFCGNKIIEGHITCSIHLT